MIGDSKSELICCQVRTEVISFAYVVPVNAPRKSYWVITYMSWKKWIMCERNKKNIKNFEAAKLEINLECFSEMCYISTLTFEFRCKEIWKRFEENLSVVPSWNAFIHIVERSQEYVNSISFRWTCTRRFSYTSATPAASGHSVHGARPGPVWVKAPWNMNNGDVGSLEVIDMPCKSIPIELQYLLIWIHIYMPPKENQVTMV